MRTQTNTDDLLRFDERSGSLESHELLAEVSKIHPAEFVHAYELHDGNKYYMYSLVRVHENPDVYIKKSYKGVYNFYTYMQYNYSRSIELPEAPRKMHKLNIKSLRAWIDYTVLCDSLLAEHEAKTQINIDMFLTKIKDGGARQYGGDWIIEGKEFSYCASINRLTGHISEKISFHPESSSFEHFLNLIHGR